jgi:glucosylglycerol-phosphate synthase
VKFFFRPFPFDEVIALYALANVMWVTPLRDGLNLVAKEFVAVQGLLQQHGVLVLSEFAGAAVELRGALLTNPFDANDLVETCYRALTLAEPEAASRMRELFNIVSHYDIRYWSDAFVADVAAIQAARQAAEARH